MPLFTDRDFTRNDMHLGPSAHRLMATEIYHGIDGVLLNPKDSDSTRSGSGSRSGSTSSTNSDQVAPKIDVGSQRHNRRGFAA